MGTLKRKAKIHAGPPVKPDGSVEQIISQDAPECGDAVFPGNLLTLRVGPARIRNRHFVNTPISFRDLRGYFRLKAEPIGSQTDAVQHLATKNLVTGLHIAQVQVGKNIREQR